ncbi:MAG: iron-containing alcohol dehydrogenase [Candidatus Omnitrophota bacterium]|nr:iron-containing alcohol dehydrogenase [Candidatus Omnitrophota bacterium]
MSCAYWNPTRRLIEEGALDKLAEELSASGAAKVLVVLGEKSFRKSIRYTKLRDTLEHFSLVESEPVVKDPSLVFAQSFAEKYRGKAIDSVVAIGGGSVMDMAKLTALLLNQPDDTWNTFWRDPVVPIEFPNASLPLVAVPTTAGTGSEVTQYASFEDHQHQKMSFAHPYLFPKLALVDPELAVSMPPAITASTGFDALSQAIEAYWSIHHMPSSDTHALRAIPLVLEQLQRAVEKPADRDARFAMAIAGNEGGLAIAQTRTTAVHSVSYPMTTIFHVPHGHACALTLASFVRFNQDAIEHERAAALWRALGAENAEMAAKHIEGLMDNVGLERRLSQVGIDEEGLESIVKYGFRPDRVKNNPRELNASQLRTMLVEIL